MTDRMRKALELIASGEGPQGGFLTRVQMIEVARESLAYVRPIPDGAAELLSTSDEMGRMWREAKRKMEDAPPFFMTTDPELADRIFGKTVEFRVGAAQGSTPPDLDARLPGYTDADAAGLAEAKQRADDAYSQMMGYMPPPMIVRDLLK
jgi:hypothetical protein